MTIAAPLHATPTPRFPPDSIWYRDISAQAADPASAAMIRAASIGAGGTLPLKIDFALRLLDGTGAPRLPLGPPDDDYRDACDAGGDVPVPPNGSLEDETGYECRNDGDCHLLVVDGATLHEAWRAKVDARGVHAACLVRWQLDKLYPEEGRGDQCTSADAAGFPIAPLTFNADEVAEAMRGNGDLGHALRFILPNSSMRARVFVRPATHAGAPKGSVDAIPYGARLRLRADVAIDNCVPPGDALVTIEGSESITGASSTVAGSAIIHSIIIEALAELARRGEGARRNARAAITCFGSTTVSAMNSTTSPLTANMKTP